MTSIEQILNQIQAEAAEKGEATRDRISCKQKGDKFVWFLDGKKASYRACVWSFLTKN